MATLQHGNYSILVKYSADKKIRTEGGERTRPIKCALRLMQDTTHITQDPGGLEEKQRGGESKAKRVKLKAKENT